MVEPTPLSQLARSLDLGLHEHVAIVGGGGKTTVLHALGDQLHGSVALTCTTKMGHDQHGGRPVLLSPSVDEVVTATAVSPVMIWKATERQKAFGVPPEWCNLWFRAIDHVVIEADGSRQRPFKAPAEYEPVAPSSVTVMASVIGADALGRVIADQCHRPLRVAALAGCTAYQRLTPQAAATVLLHERGARKELADTGRLAIVITKVADVNRSFVDDLVAALTLMEPGVTVVAVEHHDRVV